MSPIDYMMIPLKKYFDFSGRARRMEFWMFYVGVVGAYVIGSVVDGLIGKPIVSSIVGLGTIIPLIACEIRRMHDQDRSGWWILVPIANLIFLFIEGTKGDNRFGPDPKAGAAPAA